MLTLKIQFIDWPRPAIAALDKPKPDCRDCHGTGQQDIGTEQRGPSMWACHCWDPARRRVLLPLPVRVARRWFGYRTPVMSGDPPL